MLKPFEMMKRNVVCDNSMNTCDEVYDCNFFSKKAPLSVEGFSVAASKNIENIKLGSKEQRSNEVIVIKLLSLYKDKRVLENCEKSVFKSRAVMIKALQLGLVGLKEVSKVLRSDRRVVLTAIKKNPLDLKYASQKLRNDKYIVLRAFFLNKKSFVYASSKLKNNKKIALKLLEFDVKSCFFSDALDFLNKDTVFNCLGKKVLMDKDVALAAVKVNGLNLKKLSDKFKRDEDVVCAAISSHAVSIEFAHSDLFSNKNVMLKLVSRYSDWLSRCSEVLRDDKELVLSAVSYCGDNLAFASGRLKADYEIIIAACTSSVYALNYAKESVLEEIKMHMEKNGGSIKDALHYLKEKEVSKSEHLLLESLIDENECLEQKTKKTSL